MLDRNSLSGFGFITRQIRGRFTAPQPGRFTAPQPGNPHIASGYGAYLIHSPHRSLTVSTSERGVPLDLLEYLAQTYLRTAQVLSSLSDGVSLSWFR